MPRYLKLVLILVLVIVEPCFADWQTAWDPTMTGNLGDAVCRNYRNTVPADVSSYNGTKIRISITAGGADALVVGTSIGIMTSNDDFDSAPTRITWDTGNNGTTVPTSTTKTSDEMDFTFNKTNRHGIHIYTTSRNGHRYGTGGTLYYNTACSDDTLTQTVSYSSASEVDAVDLLEVYEAETGTWHPIILIN